VSDATVPPQIEERSLMITTISRVLASALILLSITVVSILPAPPVAAAVNEPDHFVIEAFPNDTVQVEFDDDWSERRPGGRRHRGSDIKSPKGTHVVAVADGIVEEMKWHRAGGWSIEITHAAGWSTHYLHLNDDSPGTNDGSGGEETAFAEGLAKGSFVRSGQVIGFVGDSGNAEVPHNHFEIQRDGTKLNPFPYLEAAWARKLSAYDKRGFMR
jgi:murein DD-endopeptidase MepM/ murein hydrolase activator NlpD